MTALPPATAALFARQRFGMTPGLDTTRALLERLGRPDRNFASIAIAGTNGKGTVAAALDAILRAAGRRSGRFVSPHLILPGERVRVGGRDLDAEHFEALAVRVLPHADVVGATLFETLTSLACLAFAEAEVEIAAMEVGLGGRLDAVNALNPLASVVTTVDLDHQEVLGHDLRSIAREKAGVFRSGRPAFTAATGEGRSELLRVAAERGAALTVLTSCGEVPHDDSEATTGTAAHACLGHVRSDPHGTRFELRSDSAPPASYRTPLLGRFAATSVALAALTATQLPAPFTVPTQAARRGAAEVRWPGRAERLVGQPPRRGELLLDGAHNPAAASAIAGLLQELAWRPLLVIGASRDKDMAAMARALAPVAERGAVATQARFSPRAAAATEVAAALAAAGIPVHAVLNDPREAVERAFEHVQGADGDAPQGPVVAVLGSLYLVGEVRAWWTGTPLPALERWQ